MGFVDTFITFGIIAAAAFYLYKKFSKSKEGGSCGCSSKTGCCKKSNGASSAHCNGTMHR